MTAGELKRILDQCSDDTRVLVTLSGYNGYREETRMEDPVLVMCDEGILVTDLITFRYHDEDDLPAEMVRLL